MKAPKTVAALNDFSRIRLSQHFYMRDFLFSDIAAVHGLLNAPDDPDLAIAAGERLCQDLLEPLQRVFGRIAIRSAYRSCEVNGLGNVTQKAGKSGYNCASNEANYAAHIWDRRDANGFMGATACIVLPDFVDAFAEPGDWTRLAWWIHDHLPYGNLYFFPVNWACNVSWYEGPSTGISPAMFPMFRMFRFLWERGTASNEQDLALAAAARDVAGVCEPMAQMCSRRGLILPKRMSA